MERDVQIKWDGPDAGAVVNGTGRPLYNFRVMVGGECRVRARKGWYEDRDIFGANASITFSRLERRGVDQVFRVRFKLGQGPNFPWLSKDLPLAGAPAMLIEEPWSLGARTRKA